VPVPVTVVTGQNKQTNKQTHARALPRARAQ
jgi:hypothetical protein